MFEKNIYKDKLSAIFHLWTEMVVRSNIENDSIHVTKPNEYVLKSDKIDSNSYKQIEKKKNQLSETQKALEAVFLFKNFLGKYGS